LDTEIVGLDKNLKWASLDILYHEEHKLYKMMPKGFLPFSPDGYGNHYCLDLSRLENGVSPVVFWQHDIDYEDITQVEVSHENLIAWASEVLIEWTLEYYNYDGSEKK